VTKELQETTHPALDTLARWFTFMGNSSTLALLAAAVLGLAFYLGVPAAGIFAVLSLLSLPINVLLKNLVDRRRPEPHEVRVLPGPRWGFSFPSGHSMGSAAFYGFLAVLVWLHVPSLAPRIALLIPFVALPPLVGASRIWLGAHWLSDVVAGIAGGAVIVVVLAILYPL
jgi:undecaprenyl-diphosphatase